MATTPPPRQAVNTPPTPFHGAKYDTYQPYSPRKSTRSAAKPSLRSEVTPPPLSSGHNLRSSSSSTSPRFTRLNISKQSSRTFSPPSSAQSSPQKKSTKFSGSNGRTTRIGDPKSESSTAAVLPPSEASTTLSLAQSNVSRAAAAMLPTPVKTPRKRTVPQEPALKATARVLFPTDPAPSAATAPSPKKKVRKGRKYNGFSLDSFTTEEGADGEGGKITIFTDSKDRLPELDESEGNPFYVKSATDTKGSKTTKRRKASSEIKRDAKVEEALGRDDGMVYVFRGKKMFRKFAADDADEWDEQDRTAPDTSPHFRHFTRSSIKPRLLFPPAAKADLVDEEAITDIEELEPVADSEMTDAIVDTEEEPLLTPVKNTFVPASPPASGRTTRSTKKIVPPEPVEIMPTDSRNRKKVSPFSSWQRSKAGVISGAGSAGKGKKREGDVMERDEGIVGKRVRSGAA